MTEFQGWLLLAMLAMIAGAISHHGGASISTVAFALIALIFGLVGVVKTPRP